ncbi:MAG TPA: cell shape determination protein CcmA [Oceanospirillales bacterium]|nr:cell shape determination protein CcmA [Oceanospirillaceae bacterium]HBS41093.1 cell shape determination protein CcmA [Oceanospirillales bacterium]|tara:strand:- start:1379 stop:1825 length:447 start_codon:yes stop_codon:yes gene_type:complete
MFGSKNNGGVRYDTLISSRTEISGDIQVGGAIHVDGMVSGNLSAEKGSKATVRVSEKGRVIGDISAPNVIINGEVKGDVRVFEHLELAQKARITGDVYYNTIEMVLGSQVNGQLKHISEDERNEAVAMISESATAEETEETEAADKVD